jgi:hypothetical protein
MQSLLFFLSSLTLFRLDRILFFHIIKADSGVSRTNPCDPINPAEPESLRAPARSNFKRRNTMFTRKPQTALTTKKNMQRSRSTQKKNTVAIPSLQPANGFANVNGVLMPF